ncbi:Hypothetical protein AA314_06145 [Archangium gephyra]|uniref:Uncharacterized protein n=1 Tax=Archangium gephyra TaxID=48 RepID=A0AAC8QBV2_9BACT|nr:Hypothetical protein AA314_06145 [Archangium gephyra]
MGRGRLLCHALGDVMGFVEYLGKIGAVDHSSSGRRAGEHIHPPDPLGKISATGCYAPHPS